MPTELAQQLFWAFLAGAIPSISMMGFSFLALQWDLSPILEATAQNFCAGISLGFLIGLIFFHFLDYFISFVEGAFKYYLDNTKVIDERGHKTKVNFSPEREPTPALFSGSYQHSGSPSSEKKLPSPHYAQYHFDSPEDRNRVLPVFGITQDDIESDQQKLSYFKTNYIIPSSKSTSFYVPTGIHDECDEDELHSIYTDLSQEEQNDDQTVLLLTTQAFSSSKHRNRVKSQVFDLLATVQKMQQKSNLLFNNPTTNLSGRNHSYNNEFATNNLSSVQIEQVCDEIDQDIHYLQYNVDHCRRLIQGSGAGFEGVIPRIWITEKGKIALQTRLVALYDYLITLLTVLNDETKLPPSLSNPELLTVATATAATATTGMDTATSDKHSAEAMIHSPFYPEINTRTPMTYGSITSTSLPARNHEILDSSNHHHHQHQHNISNKHSHTSTATDYSPPPPSSTLPLLLPPPKTSHLINIYEYLDAMDKEIHALHHVVEGYSFKWGSTRQHRHHSKSRRAEIPFTGSVIPWSFVIPVLLDGIIDGLLLGTTSSFSWKAGMILSLANGIEMGLLGIAVSIRIRKCTASSLSARYLAMCLPPLAMWISSIFGGYAGYISSQHRIWYLAFIAFGIVALLYLVVNELLVEANELLGGKETWWSGLIVFMGIYLVLLLDAMVPT